MLAAQKIRNLPGSLDLTVLFDLSTLRGLVADETVRAIHDHTHRLAPGNLERRSR